MAAFNTSTNCSYTSSTVIDTLDTVVCSSIAIFGIVGNLFSIAVFHRTAKLRRLTSSVYLTALAVSDSIFLITLLLSTLALPLLKRSLTCKGIFYFMNVSGVFSSWLVVLFTVERFVVIYFPINKIVKFSPRRARYLVSFLIPVPFLMYVYTAVELIDVDPVSLVCHWRKEYVFTVAVMHSVEICSTYFVPALIVVALNSRIGLKLIKSDVQRQCMRSGSMLSNVGQHVNGGGGGQATGAFETGTRTAADGMDDDEHHRGLGGHAGGSGLMKQFSLRFSRSRSIKSMSGIGLGSMITRGPSRLGDRTERTSTLELSATRTLIVISTAFAVLNLPHNLVLLVKLIFQLSSRQAEDDECVESSQLMNVLTSVCNALYYANFAVNIVVYHLTSCNYRQGASILLTRTTRVLVTTGQRVLVAVGLLDARKLAQRNAAADLARVKQRRFSRRRELERAMVESSRFAFLQILHRNEDEKKANNNDASPSRLPTIENGDERRADGGEWYENEPLPLSTIPEIDGNLTDVAKSNPIASDSDNDDDEEEES